MTSVLMVSMCGLPSTHSEFCESLKLSETDNDVVSHFSDDQFDSAGYGCEEKRPGGEHRVRLRFYAHPHAHCLLRFQGFRRFLLPSHAPGIPRQGSRIPGIPFISDLRRIATNYLPGNDAELPSNEENKLNFDWMDNWRGAIPSLHICCM